MRIKRCQENWEGKKEGRVKRCVDEKRRTRTEVRKSIGREKGEDEKR